MQRLYVRTVFFVADVPRALEGYVDRLGFTLDWSHEEDGRPFVVQVSLMGLELILNQAEDATRNRPGHGRVFVSLEVDQLDALRRHFAVQGIEPETVQWGAPTEVVRDLDGNELFFWLPNTQGD